MTDENPEAQRSGPPFLCIPIARLIVLSILSCGIYEAYWIYEHWAHIKRRHGLKISPFWRGAFCVFYCHSLLKRIHADAEMRAIQEPSFSPRGLANGWIIAIIAANFVDLAPGAIATFGAFLVPSYLFFVPAQKYVNSAIHKKDPTQPYHRWSFGHVLCLVLGLVIWVSTIVSFSFDL